jgi:hypothetical protein
MAAITSPLLDFPITKAKGIVFNVVGGEDMSLQEINAAAEVIYENVDSDANIIFGAMVDDSNALDEGEIAITVLATGFNTDFFDQRELSNRKLDQLQERAQRVKPTTAGAAKRISEVASTVNKLSAVSKETSYMPMSSKRVPARRSRVEEMEDIFDEAGDEDDADEDNFGGSRTRRSSRNKRVRGGAKRRVGGIFGFIKRLLFG